MRLSLFVHGSFISFSSTVRSFPFRLLRVLLLLVPLLRFSFRPDLSSPPPLHHDSTAPLLFQQFPTLWPGAMSSGSAGAGQSYWTRAGFP